MNTKRSWPFIVLLLGFAIKPAIADDIQTISAKGLVEPLFCSVAESENNLQKKVYLTQQKLDDGAQELVLIAKDVENGLIVKRITYQQRQVAACHFPAIAMTRGGDWGWFLVWADAEKIYYTRMDAEALVFPPIKSLSIGQITQIEFLPDTALPTMRVVQQNGQAQLLNSDDEGRHWQVVN